MNIMLQNMFDKAHGVDNTTFTRSSTFQYHLKLDMLKKEADNAYDTFRSFQKNKETLTNPSEFMTKLIELENQETDSYEKGVMKTRHHHVNSIVYDLEKNFAYDTNSDSISSSSR